MKYAKIKYNDISNGEGIRTSLFVSGCPHHCKGCFNEIAWDFNYGEEYTIDTILDIYNSVNSKYITGLSILGGEPLAFENLIDVYSTIAYIKQNTGKSIWLYTGYVWEGIIKNDFIKNSILPLCDVIVDGPFIEELYSISLKFRGSANQRIIDVQKSLEQNKIVLYYE